MKAELKCKNCGKTLSGRWKRFCSRRCGSLLYIRTHHVETDIEKKFREWLEMEKIGYEAQATVQNITVPDFKIGNTLIFVDGDYWHDRPKRKYHDQRINNRLIKLGYEVLRYKGSDVLNNFSLVQADAIKHLKIN